MCNQENKKNPTHCLNSDEAGLQALKKTEAGDKSRPTLNRLNSDQAALQALKEVDAEDNSRPTLQSFVILEILKWAPFTILSLLLLSFFINWLRS
jgi:hypothetical protein